MTENKKDKRKTIIQRILTRAAPIVIGVAGVSWAPVFSSSAENSGDKDAFNTGVLAKNHISYGDDAPKLAMAEPSHANAYAQSIGQVSIDTETGDLKNPPSVATGNGYYGQHQFGNSVKNDFCVKKYIAYALINSSPKFKKSLCDNLLSGKQAYKDKLIDDFAASLDKYDAKQKTEFAYLSTNPAYRKLSTIMSVKPTTFTAAHTKFEEEAKRLQSQFVYEIYLQQMPNSLKNTIAANPQIKFESIRPAVMASIVAIAVKQGNGSRFKKAMEKATFAAYQLQAQRCWEADTSSNKSKEAPLTVACKTGDLNKDNIAVIGKTVRIYDTENSGIKSRDILVPSEYHVMMVRGPKPKNVTDSREVMTFNTQKDAADIAEIVNNKDWLKDYCGSFKAVYNKAVSQIDKIPTLDTYYEMSIILNKPGLYKIAEDYHKQNPPTLALNNALVNKALRDRYQNS